MRRENWRGMVAGVVTVVVLGAVGWFVGVPVSEWAVGQQGSDLSRVDWLTAMNNARSSLLTGSTSSLEPLTEPTGDIDAGSRNLLDANG